MLNPIGILTICFVKNNADGEKSIFQTLNPNMQTGYIWHVGRTGGKPPSSDIRKNVKSNSKWERDKEYRAHENNKNVVEWLSLPTPTSPALQKNIVT